MGNAVVYERETERVVIPQIKLAQNFILADFVLCENQLGFIFGIKTQMKSFFSDCDELFICVWSVSGECVCPRGSHTQME